MAAMGRRVSLDQAPAAEPLRVVATAPDAALARRLASLGWRDGRPVRVLGATVAGARVVDIDGGRVALSRQIARSLQVEIVPVG